MRHLLVWHGQVYAFLWGAIWGSFLNVVIHRLPRGLSLVRPGSRCGSCEKPVRWYDNVPILAWFWLRGKCRDCGVKFSFRYAAVEGLTGCLALALYHVIVLAGLETGAPPMWLLAVFMVRFSFTCALVVVTFIDIELQLVPTLITGPGALLGILAAVLLGEPSVWDSAIGMVLGGGVLVTINALYRVFRDRDGFGGGDVSLLAMIGAFLGFKSLLFILLAASFQGTLAALLFGAARALFGVNVGLKSADDLEDPEEGDWRPMDEASNDTPVHAAAIAFVPYLALAAMEWMIVGPAVVRWYWTLVLGHPPEGPT